MLKEESKMNRIKVGIIGCGGIFRNLHAPYYEEPNRRADIVAVADVAVYRSKEQGKQVSLPL